MGRRRTDDLMRLARALALVLALLLQGLAPAAALAHDEAPSSRLIQICTGDGLRSVQAASPHSKHHGFGGLACEQCVMASLTMVAAEPPGLAARFDVVAFAYRPVSERPSILPRAPPRPPSQGPPTSV